ncbi:class I SAM-dependent methyltransferase [Olivibacter domesticus]|uniref:Methyltransferase domain-containing protein n=1 Tax=Olivibacter domesticus TaxID=407022 RepID=A0A1H7LX91_OLID1|nr:class I SAM-dependent methyltransferase [Olivibacter domesticus]SEL03502.1 Methyltransferase domain-containing protein [Olivibacter domesticus]
MKENKYDEPAFFEQYGKMNRSVKGLSGAGEWYLLKEILPDLKGKDVLDLGCGFGWHCRYATEKGAASVTGIDISEKMLKKAKEINHLQGIKYERTALEDAVFPANHFDVVFSSLTLHYIKSYDALIRSVYQWLRPGGSFVFSVEHPVFTAQGMQDWIYNETGDKLYWPVDKYFSEGQRDTSFLGEHVIKYHRTIATYLNELLKENFKLTAVEEPMPSEEMLKHIPEMREELRRPMMLLIAVDKL